MSLAIRAYAGAFVEESLGLPVGVLDSFPLPSVLVETITGAVRGDEKAISPDPTVEVAINAFAAEMERAEVERSGFFVRKARWPGNATYAAALTHDVDNIARPRRHLIERRARFNTGNFLLALLGIRSVYDNIAYVAGLERARGFRSSFYLLSSEYDLGKVSAELRSLQRDGWDIGLHGDFGTHDSAAKFAEALSRLKSETGVEPAGVREHHLRFDFRKTWGIADSAGLDYDTSVGNRDVLGFRIGLATPFHPPDAAWRPIRLLELPLVLMDTTLWGYLKRTEEEGRSDFMSLKKKVAGVNGLFTLLWHQEAARMRGGRIYPRLLDELRADRCFVGTGGQVAGWWRKRGAPLTRSGQRFLMDDAPSGLCLLIKAKEELTASANGGVAQIDGKTGVVIANGGRLEVKLG